MISEMKTPYYLIHKDQMKNGINVLKDALDKEWPNYAIGYSYKTNALPWIINYYKQQGCFAEVVSGDEYHLAKSIGAEKIIYNGIAKTKDSFLEAVQNKQIVNIDSEYEINWLDELETGCHKVGIRVNFDLESKCPGQTQCGEEGERFGFCYENGELKKAIDRIESKGIKVNGLHLHKSSRTRMPDIYKAISEAAVEIADRYEMSLEYVDIGGGFFGGLENKPQFSEYFSLVSEILKKKFSPLETALIVEPGMALVGASVDFITTVIDIKKTTRNTFVVTDGSRTQIDPLMTKHSYYHDIIRRINPSDGQRKVVKKQVVSGYTCMEHDRLFEVLDAEELCPGDKICYHKVGAYTMCLSPLFIQWFPDVYVKDADTVYKVRDRWDSESYKCRSILI